MYDILFDGISAEKSKILMDIIDTNVDNLIEAEELDEDQIDDVM